MSGWIVWTSVLNRLKAICATPAFLIESQEHNIRLIAEQYGDISEKLDKANDRAAQLDDMRERAAHAGNSGDEPHGGA